MTASEFRNVGTESSDVSELTASEFRNVGTRSSDAGRLPRRNNTAFNTRRKFEVKIKCLPYPQKQLLVFVLDNLMTNPQIHKLQNLEGGGDHIAFLNFA